MFQKVGGVQIYVGPPLSKRWGGPDPLDPRHSTPLHPSGGVAVLYRTKQAKYITPLYFNLDWVIGICINNDNNKHIVMCVYMKTALGGHGDNREIFQGQLEELKMIIDDLDTTSVTIIGDWNADVLNPTHPHGPLLKQFSGENGLVISSEMMLPINSFTFISEMKLDVTL